MRDLRRIAVTAAAALALVIGCIGLSACGSSNSDGGVSEARGDNTSEDKEALAEEESNDAESGVWVLVSSTSTTENTEWGYSSTSKFEYTHDEHGNLMSSHSESTTEMGENTQESTNDWTYVRDENGYLQESYLVYNGEEDELSGFPESKVTNTFDDSGKLVSSVEESKVGGASYVGGELQDPEYHVTSEATYTYDASGNLIRKEQTTHSYSPDEDVHTSVTAYSPDGNILSVSSDDGTSTSYEYKRDADGYVVKSMTYDTDGNLTGTTTFINDENGNPIESTYESADGSVTGSTTSEYRYIADPSPAVRAKLD